VYTNTRLSRLRLFLLIVVVFFTLWYSYPKGCEKGVGGGGEIRERK
jgi:hypothetical protein